VTASATGNVRELFTGYAARRKRKISNKVIQAALAAVGPDWELCHLWLKLWQRRDTRKRAGSNPGPYGVVEQYSNMLMVDVDWRPGQPKGHDSRAARAWRRAIKDGAGWNLWHVEGGFYQPKTSTRKPTRLYLRPPEQWRSEWREPVAVAAGSRGATESD
jgi:hypothetical protein